MKVYYGWIPVAAVSLALALGSNARAVENQANQGTMSVAQQKQECENQARPELEQQRKQAEMDARKNLDKQAVAVIGETTDAIKAIGKNNAGEAEALIQKATGKIDILLSHHPVTALLPVDVDVTVVEAAPYSTGAIKARAVGAELAMSIRDFPDARALLDSLTSEIRVRTVNLPLDSYPDFLKDAALLLDQKKPREAAAILLAALNTLAIVDQAVPLPLALARADIVQAQAMGKNQREALEYLRTAKAELERARLLGYAGNSPEYIGFNDLIDELEKQIRANGNTESIFTNLKEKLTAFFVRESGTRRPS